MNGSTRYSAPPIMVAPYAAPRLAELRNVPNAAAAHSPADTATATLVPFIPPGFRNELGFAQWKGVAVRSPASEGLNDVDPKSFTDSSLRNNADARVDVEPSLPWIEAFAADDSAVIERESASNFESTSETHDPALRATDVPAETSDDENWMLGEAAKRLNELTERLTSLDASRAEQAEKSGHRDAQTQSHGSEDGAPSALPMWGDDEWMDIMPPPTLAATPVEQPLQTEVAAPLAPFHDDAHQQALEAAATEAIEAQLRHAEAAALALESVARRIRAGDFAVSDIEPEMGEAAMLAGVLALLLRTGRQ